MVIYIFTVYLELQRQVDQFFMSQVLGKDINIDISTKDYPKIYLRVSTESQEVCLGCNWCVLCWSMYTLQAANAAVFLFCGITFQVSVCVLCMYAETSIFSKQKHHMSDHKSHLPSLLDISNLNML